MKISLLYFLIGAVWMGFGEMIPMPAEEHAHGFYDTARIHLMLLGWASFAIIGTLYYLIPKAAEKELYSNRLGRAHLWITNITLPIGILLFTYGSFVIDSLIKSGLTAEQARSDPSLIPVVLPYVIVFIVGFAAQILFVYNLYKTMRK